MIEVPPPGQYVTVKRSDGRVEKSKWYIADRPRTSYPPPGSDGATRVKICAWEDGKVVCEDPHLEQLLSWQSL